MKNGHMLYRSGTQLPLDNGRTYDTVIVPAAGVPDKLKDGWYEHPNDVPLTNQEVEQQKLFEDADQSHADDSDPDDTRKGKRAKRTKEQGADADPADDENHGN